MTRINILAANLGKEGQERDEGKRYSLGWRIRQRGKGFSSVA